MRLSLLRQTRSEVRPSPTPVMSSSLPPPTCFTSATSGSPMATRATLVTWMTFCCPTPRLMVPPSACARAGAAASRVTTSRRRLRMSGAHISKSRPSGAKPRGAVLDGDFEADELHLLRFFAGPRHLPVSLSRPLLERFMGFRRRRGRGLSRRRFRFRRLSGLPQQLAVAITEVRKIGNPNQRGHLDAIPGDDEPRILPGGALDDVGHAVAEFGGRNVGFSHAQPIAGGSDTGGSATHSTTLQTSPGNLYNLRNLRELGKLGELGGWSEEVVAPE